MKSVVIYARFSPRRNGEDCESNEVQIAECKKWCNRNERTWRAHHIYQEALVSGKEEVNRPALWAAIEGLRKGWDLLVYKLDRLARNVYLSEIILRECTKRGARVTSSRGEGTWSDSPEDELTRTILSAFNQFERRVIAARTKSAMIHHQQQGRRMTHISCVPWGTVAQPDDATRIMENAEEQATVATAIELRAGGMGLREIGRALTEGGHKARGRGAIHHQTVKRMLARYNGLALPTPEPKAKSEQEPEKPAPMLAKSEAEAETPSVIVPPLPAAAFSPSPFAPPAAGKG